MRALDQLEEQIDKGFFLSFINKIVVDEKKIFTIINELRSLVSEQFAQDAVPSETPSSEPVLPSEPVSHDPEPEFLEPVQALEWQQDARDLIDKARQEAEALRRGADDYADEMLVQLEDQLRGALDSIRQGRLVIEQRKQKAGGELHGSSEV